MSRVVKKIVGIGVFTAIVVVLQLLGGGIKVGSLFSITLVLVPIVVGAAVYDWYAGTWLGFIFGVTVLLTGDAAAFMAVNPLATIAVVLIKGALCGTVAGLIYKALSKWNNVLAVISAAILCPVANTGVFLIGCKLFFLETVREWAALYGYPDAASYMFLGLAGINFLVELGVNIILAPVIIRVIRIGQR